MARLWLMRAICGLILASFLFVTVSGIPLDLENIQKTNKISDFDPLVDVEVTVDVQKIRSLEKYEYPNPKTFEKIDLLSAPDFFVKVLINDQEFTSPTWNNIKYVYNPQFSPTADVPDDVEEVNIKIQLWDWSLTGNRLCDISRHKSKFDVDLTYNIISGHWTGDDYLTDASGYRRLNGCDDGSIYASDRDCELWFDIYQNDFDGDGIPYLIEVDTYGTDPTVDNRGQDPNNDGIPIEWDYKWGYDPFAADNHKNLDPDDDGLNNLEEYLVSQWDSNPFRQDIFVELDQMEAGPNGEPASLLPSGAKELLYTAFNRYNKVFHIDDGSMGGGEMIPFHSVVGHGHLDDFYDDYFLHGSINNWRKGVFRYSLVVYDPGMAGYNFGRGAFVIGVKYVDKKVVPNTVKNRDIAYASVYMHETGHTLRLFNPGVDNHNTKYPWQMDYWVYGPYKSCMNYRYTYRLVDYSDGSRPVNDFEDWENMDLTRFQHQWP
jgi:hypothetical protein